MEVKYDGKLVISTGLSADSSKWRNEEITWGSLIDKLQTVVRTRETLDQYLKATREEQMRIKDIGGFVGGYINGNKRKATNILYRQIITLDIDFGYKDLWFDFTMQYGNAALIHATHKSSESNPRYRLIMPLDREVSTEEYMAIARRIAGNIGMRYFDRSTFQINRLMFWPSCPIDVKYYCEVQDGPWLNADKVLGSYLNWKDVTEWPMASDENDPISLSAKKQENPLDKKGIVGLFCRAYDIKEAIDTFLSDDYVEAGEGRYTYTKGSTAAGLVVYDDVFAYSHHGTDPAGGRLCNAFDLVRIHKFGHLDANSKQKTETELKSYKEMEIFASNDSKVKRVIAEENFERAKKEFSIPDEDFAFEEEDRSWVEGLDVDTKGKYLSTATNINLILQNDAILKKALMFNRFDNRRYIGRSLPWRKLQTGDPEPLRDVDYSGIRNYIESVYGIVAVGKIDDAMALEFEKNSFHPIQDYILSLKWDGKHRVDTLLIDYFGADDNVYTRAAMRKTLCAAVARVFCPGTKFDTVLVLVGTQGEFKSTFIRKLGVKWFSDTLTTVQGKEAFEQIQSAWLIEIAELSSLKKAEVETIKQFISKQEDIFRPAYGRTVEIFKRQCVFFGTTNDKDFLRDPTGNRRFNPIDVKMSRVKKSVTEDLTEEEVAQIWAEAYQLYLGGEKLYLVGEEDRIANKERRIHSVSDERTGIIEEYLNQLYPENWGKMNEYERADWLGDPLHEEGKDMKMYTCVAEIWCECLGRNKNDMSRYNTREINDMMHTLDEWEYVNSTRTFPIYGKQKYYQRKLI